jgi:hypothetical protein
MLVVHKVKDSFLAVMKQMFLELPKDITSHSKAMQPNQRYSYSMDREFRPLYRGSLVAFLHRTSTWLFVSIVYCTISAMMIASPASVALRIKFCLATLWGVWASDWLHNLDRVSLPSWHHAREIRSKKCYFKTPGISDLEAFYLQHDFISISTIITANYILWCDNLRWDFGLATASLISVGCTALLSILVLVGKPEGPRVLGIKIILGIQFVVLYLYMIVCQAWQAADNNPCSVHSIVWFTYLPGILCYAVKPYLPQFQKFGPHEIFHAFVFLGHLCSMVLDVINMAWPCRHDNSIF